MERKIYKKLLEWKQQSNGKSALLIDGARRVGKSYIVKQFAEKEYKSYILIDFNKASKQIRDLFDNYLHNLVVPPVQVRNMVKVHNMYAKILIIN